MEQEKSRKLFIIKICALAAGTAVLLILLADVTGSYRLQAADDAVFKAVRRLECPFSTGFFKLMSNLVNPAVLFIISMAMIHILRQKKYLIVLFANLVLVVLLNVAAKGWVMRERPPMAQRLIQEVGYSFPSGHAMLAASFYGFIIFLLWQTKKKKIIKIEGTIVCLLVTALVGISRIYLGVHYWTDVMGGFVAALIYLLIYTSVAKRYFENGLPIKGQMAEREVHPLIKSFEYAFSGVIAGIKTERNMMIHYSALGLVVVFGITLKISVTEWCICLILCALVISMELVNTAVEAVVDLVTHDKKRRAKIAKDTAAGAVLIAAITAAVIGGIIFIPKIMALFTA